MTTDQKLSYLAYSQEIMKIVGKSEMSLTDCATILLALQKMKALVIPTEDEEEESK